VTTLDLTEGFDEEKVVTALGQLQRDKAHTQEADTRISEELASAPTPAADAPPALSPDELTRQLDGLAELLIGGATDKVVFLGEARTICDKSMATLDITVNRLGCVLLAQLVLMKSILVVVGDLIRATENSDLIYELPPKE